MKLVQYHSSHELGLKLGSGDHRIQIHTILKKSVILRCNSNTEP